MFLFRGGPAETNAHLGICRIGAGRRSLSRPVEEGGGGFGAGAWSVYVFTDRSPALLGASVRFLFVLLLDRFVFDATCFPRHTLIFCFSLLFCFCLQVCASLRTLFLVILLLALFWIVWKGFLRCCWFLQTQGTRKEGPWKKGVLTKRTSSHSRRAHVWPPRTDRNFHRGEI